MELGEGFSVGVGVLSVVFIETGTASLQFPLLPNSFTARTCRVVYLYSQSPNRKFPLQINQHDGNAPVQLTLLHLAIAEAKQVLLFLHSVKYQHIHLLVHPH